MRDLSGKERQEIHERFLLACITDYRADIVKLKFKIRQLYEIIDNNNDIETVRLLAHEGVV